MRNAKNIALVSILAVLTLGSALSVRAQYNPSFITNPSAIRDNDIGVDLIPEVPGPNQNVKLLLTSYATNMNKAIITWSVDGKEAISGTGRTTFIFTTGDIGSKTEIGIAIVLEEGSRIDKRIIIQPSQVDLLWEASESYVPPFYKGKTLAVQESRVKVVALPLEKDGSIEPENKVYNWKKNYVVDQENSGYGKYSFVVRNSYMDQSDNVSVNVSNKNGGGSTGLLPIRYTKPQIMLYEKNPALGLKLDKLLNSGFTISDREITLSAEPFYFSKTGSGILGKNMEYKWIVNGSNIVPPEKSNELTLRGSKQSGTAMMSIAVTNTITLFQEARQNTSVTLGK